MNILQSICCCLNLTDPSTDDLKQALVPNDGIIPMPDTSEKSQAVQTTSAEGYTAPINPTPPVDSNSFIQDTIGTIASLINQTPPRGTGLVNAASSPASVSSAASSRNTSPKFSSD